MRKFTDETVEFGRAGRRIVEAAFDSGDGVAARSGLDLGRVSTHGTEEETTHVEIGGGCQGGPYVVPDHAEYLRGTRLVVIISLVVAAFYSLMLIVV